MRSIVTVTTPPSVTKLTTVERVKAELSITGSGDDVLLGSKIEEASSDIDAHLGRTLARATLTQTIWNVGWAEFIMLDRAPVASITSVTVDDVAVDADEYRLDSDTGILYHLDASGFPCGWWSCKSIVIVYVAGFLLPGESGRNLPPALESAAVELVASYWSNKGRDPTIKSERVDGLGQVDYWVGAVGEAGELPPSVVAKISPFRRPQA